MMKNKRRRAKMENKKKFFNKTNKNISVRQKFDYIHNHFYYYTMNSWNETKSLANNVKIYNLPLTKEQEDKFFELYCDENLIDEMYFHINTILEDFALENEFEIAFNGRSGGYLVAYNKNNNSNVIDEDLIDFESYDEAIKYYKEYYGWSFRDCQAELKSIIERNFAICVLFDDCCDDVLNELKYLLDNARVEEEEIVVSKKVNVLHIGE